MSSKQFADSLHKQQQKFAPDQVNMAAGERKPAALDNVEPRAVGVMDEQFPVELKSEDPRDKEMVARLQLGGTGDALGYTPFGRMEARDGDFKWYQQKMAEAEVANFQQWFAKNFDLMSPAQKEVAKKLYPEFYAQRKKLLKKQVKNLYGLAKIKLDGVESMKDLKKQYLAETGRLDIGPTANLLNPEKVNLGSMNQNKEANTKRFVRGLANPFLVFGKETVVPGVAVGVDTRDYQQKQFGQREYDGVSQKLGVDNVGFPPFAGQQTNLGDKAWWTQLQTGLPTF